MELKANGRRSKNTRPALIDPWQTSLGTPQMIQCFNHMDKTLLSIDSRLESVDGRLKSIDLKLFSMDGKLDIIAGQMDVGFTTTAGLLRQILDRLPEQEEAKSVAKAEDWVRNAVATRDLDALFTRLKDVVQKDVNAANEAIGDRFRVVQDIPTRFMIIQDKGSYQEQFISFDQDPGCIAVGEVAKGPGSPDRFIVTSGWNEAEERMDLTVKDDVDTETFSADELWRVSRRALSWMLF